METTFNRKHIDLAEGDSALIIRNDKSFELSIRHDAHLVSNLMVVTEPVALMLTIATILHDGNRDLLDELGRRTAKTLQESGIIATPMPMPEEKH